MRSTDQVYTVRRADGVEEHFALVNHRIFGPFSTPVKAANKMLTEQQKMGVLAERGYVKRSYFEAHT